MGGPTNGLKILKLNLGRIRTNKNKKKINKSPSLIGTDPFGSEQILGFEPVIILGKLNKDSHLAVRFMGNDSTKSNGNKENTIFLFGNSNTKQAQSNEGI